MMIIEFFTTKIGRWFAATGAILLAISFALLKAFSAGKASEKAKEDRESLQNLRNRAKTDEEVSKLPDADVDRDLGKWVRPDDR